MTLTHIEEHIGHVQEWGEIMKTHETCFKRKISNSSVLSVFVLRVCPCSGGGISQRQRAMKITSSWQAKQNKQTNKQTDKRREREREWERGVKIFLWNFSSSIVSALKVFYHGVFLCVCARARARACVRACVRVCVSEGERDWVSECVCLYVLWVCVC